MSTFTFDRSKPFKSDGLNHNIDYERNHQNTLDEIRRRKEKEEKERLALKNRNLDPTYMEFNLPDVAPENNMVNPDFMIFDPKLK